MVLDHRRETQQTLAMSDIFMMKDASNLLGKKNVVIFGDSSELKLFIIIFFVIKVAVCMCMSDIALITCSSVKFRHCDLCLLCYIILEYKYCCL